jgi:hypothetical protein
MAKFFQKFDSSNEEEFFQFWLDELVEKRLYRQIRIPT